MKSLYNDLEKTPEYFNFLKEAQSLKIQMVLKLTRKFKTAKDQLFSDFLHALNDRNLRPAFIAYFDSVCWEDVVDIINGDDEDWEEYLNAAIIRKYMKDAANPL